MKKKRFGRSRPTTFLWRLLSPLWTGDQAAVQGKRLKVTGRGTKGLGTMPF
jgi:hypothetical protein